MKQWMHWMIGLALPLAGLQASCAAGAPGPAPVEERAGEAASASSLADTCPGTRWIGRVPPGGACPSSNAPWIGAPLFGGIAPPVPAPLDEFCLYEWTGSSTPAPGALPSLGDVPASAWLDSDCMVVAPLTTDAADATQAVVTTLAQSFHAQVEAPASIPPAPTLVRLAVVDSWPAIGVVGNSPHGFGMGMIARDLTCLAVNPSGPCYLSLAPALALDVVEPGVRDAIEGGYFGWQGRLARAVVQSVAAWQSTAPASKLIINLSVGWDERYNLAPDGTLSAAAEAARAALEHAACAGALVIAAAGNASGGPSPGVGPMVPAAWETELAPACAGPVPRPLVYAAGGVDALDRPLESTRPGGRPRLAAPSFAVPAASLGGGSPYLVGPFTGTSVSAAVVSAAAATVWHLDGALRPDQVMALVSSSGALLPADPADFCLAPSCGVVRRVSLCRAAEAALHAPLACAKIAPGAGVTPRWTPGQITAVESLVSNDYDGVDLTQLVTPAGCSDPLFIPAASAAFSGPHPCPSEHLPNETLVPAVTPQPGTDPCPACSYRVLNNGSTIELIINERLLEPVYPQVLVLSNRAGIVERYDLQSAEDTTGVPLAAGLVPGGVYEVAMPLPGVEYGTEFDYATIEWVSSSVAQTSSALLVWEE